MLSTQSEAAGASPTRAWPADQVERWPIERLLPYANNARLHSEADLDKIAASISNWGWTMPVLADEDGVLIAGHLRVAAAAKLKLTSIPVVVARGWSEEEKNSYRLADNELAARASWDPDLLRNELRKLEFAGFNLDLVGFQPDRLEDILAGLGSSGLTDPDSVPEIPEQPVTRLGDIWLLGDHRIGCGDSTSAADVAPVLAGSGPPLMVTDPPYGVSYDPSGRARRGLGAFGTGLCTAMSPPPVWRLAGCSRALRSSGPNSTSPWAAAIIIGSTKPAGTPCAKARSATGKATARRRRSGRSPTTIRSATRSASRVGDMARRSRSSACAVRSPPTAGPARRSMTRFSVRAAV